jgi:tRNA threonylcarbamoyladenosine biosynthesis protein TsaE
MTTRRFETRSEAETESLARRWAGTLASMPLITVAGNLGVGKTVFVRGLLRGLGHAGAVKSPTFTLVEPYQFAARSVYHFDLYRVENTDEIELLGFRDYLRADSLCIVEWPERAGALLPRPDIAVMMERTNNEDRVLQLQPHTDLGAAAFDKLR